MFGIIFSLSFAGCVPIIILRLMLLIGNIDNPLLNTVCLCSFINFHTIHYHLGLYISNVLWQLENRTKQKKILNCNMLLISSEKYQLKSMHKHCLKVKLWQQRTLLKHCLVLSCYRIEVFFECVFAEYYLYLTLNLHLKDSFIMFDSNMHLVCFTLPQNLLRQKIIFSMQH